MTLIDILLSDILLKAFLAGAVVACGCGVLGCFVVWRRMAFFGDAIAHSSVLGITLGILAGLDIAVFLVCLLFALAVLWIQKFKFLGNDSILGVVSHTALAGGVILLYKVPVDVEAALFGDVLALSWRQIIISAVATFVALTLVCSRWRALLMLTFSEPIARAEGFAGTRTRLLLLIAVTITVAVAVQLVGVLMASSLLLIPAATASCLARKPETAATLALGCAFLANIAGLMIAAVFDQPVGPVIVLSAAAMFIFSLFLSAYRY